MQAMAQYPEDALRLSTPGFGVGARAMGMGNAYTGVSSDYSAIYWNPAGLAQMTLGEFSMGLSYLNTQDDGKFFGTTEGASNNVMNFNSFGIAHPVPVRRGSLVLAFGFHRESNFNSGLEFSGFNPLSSIIQYWAPDSGAITPDVTIAEQLALADTLNDMFRSPIKNRVTQTGNVTEGGGLNNWSVAGAIDLGPNLSAGVTLTYVAGSYRYDRAYTEEDRNGHYNNPPFDFSSLQVDEFIDGDITGVTAKFGLMYRVPERFRIGFTVKTPTAFSIKENYGLTAQSTFDNADVVNYSSDVSSDYDVRTPWVIGGGASVTLRDLVLCADAEFTDWTTLEFTDATGDLLKMNRQIKSLFRPTLEWRLGAEYDIAKSGIRLRGGFGYRPSPYKDDPSEFDRKTASGGIGILLSNTVMLDVAYSHSWWKNYRSNYPSNDPASSRVDESLTWNTVLATLSYRF
jgi:long-subunit fatty acid transport protein